MDILGAAGLHVDREAAHEALQAGGQFNAIDPTSGWKADLIFRKAREFSSTEFKRRQRSELFGIEVALTTLEWSQMGDSDLQRRDIRELLEIAGPSVDSHYLHHWIERLDLVRAWRTVTGTE